LTSSVNFVHPDITLGLDLSGVIRRAVLSNAIASEGISGWVGRRWADTVAGGNAQVQQMIDDARTTGVSPFHRVRQRFPSGLELSIEYTTVRLGGDAGLIAIGRNLEAVAELRSRLVAARMSMERDYWKLRDVEMRYRLFFDASSQPVLLIDADDLRILEANPAAVRALGVATGGVLLEEIVSGQQDLFRGMLARAREQQKAPGIVLHLGAERQPWLVRASLVAAEQTAVFLLQLSPTAVAASPGHRPNQDLEEMMARLPEGLVVLDSGGTILAANRTFLELVQHTEEGSVVGQRLDRWLCRQGSEAEGLEGHLRHQQTVREFTARVRGELATEVDVEVTFVGGVNEAYVLLHRVPEGKADAPPPAPSPPGAELDRAAMRKLIEQSVASVERTCILAALELARGREATAQVPDADGSSSHGDTPAGSK
jgi:transcriptional regulator PpsR